MKNFGRNFIIAFLMALAIYQTCELWFGGFSDHNFFSFFSENTSSNINTPYILDRLIINLGDNKVVCRANGIYDSEYKEVFDKAVATALEKGTLAPSEGINWNSVLQSRCIIYEYNCLFYGADIPDIFSVRSDNSGKIGAYDKIIVLPKADSSLMNVIFYDSRENNGVTLELRDNKIIGQCFEECSRFNQEDQSIYYISSVQNGFSIFSDNQFIPRWQEDIYEYPLIEPRSVLTDSTSIESNVNIFFDNPAGKTLSRQGGTYTFSDETAVVKYYNTGVLEYSNYRASENRGSGFSDNYSAAVGLINSDTFVTNQYYLDSYEHNEDTYIFRFNYKVNDLSVVPGEELREKTGMQSFIEITATNGKIDRYKKYAFRYSIDPKDRGTADTDFITAIDGLYSRLYKNGVTKPVDSIALCYIAGNKSFGLSWIIDIENISHIVDTKAGD